MKVRLLGLVIILVIVISCNQERSCREEMSMILEKYGQPLKNNKISNMDSLLIITQSTPAETTLCGCLKVHLLMELGQKTEAIKMMDVIIKQDTGKMLNTATFNCNFEYCMPYNFEEKLN